MEESREESAADDLLRIAPDMLRDLKVTTLVVEAHRGAEEASMLGEIQVDADRHAHVAAPIPAQVVALRASTNERVGRGQVLVELRSVELGRARAEHMSAEARVELSRQTLDRKRVLSSERITARREVEEAEANLKAAEAELRAAAAELSSLGASPEPAGDDPSRYELRSPIAGVVLERTAVIGQQIDPSQTLFEIAALDRVWLVVQAFERDAARVRVGASALVTFPALPGRTFEARVDQVGLQVDADSRTVPIRLTLENSEGLFRPGMSATAAIDLGGDGVSLVAVPAASLQRLADDWVVFLPRAEGAFEIRAVGRGRDLGGEIELVSGLSPGETVVVEGAFLLKAEADKARGAGEAHEH
ncbi:MAG TPA: efflux RND transporter periplasmic adaptor subunit [Vicinamibacteria bacterium]|nr:efflux RND transporter periplasmic adaptor subunit [Vicinamibacteria bacterium]